MEKNYIYIFFYNPNKQENNNVGNNKKLSVFYDFNPWNKKPEAFYKPHKKKTMITLAK